MPYTARTDPRLSLICLSFHLIGKGTNTQKSFISREDIFIDSRFFGHIFILHEYTDLFFEFLRIIIVLLKLVIETPPIHSLHLSAIVREYDLDPRYHILIVEPECIRIRVVLMLRHVLLDMIL
jgi:hypothetical protein